MPAAAEPVPSAAPVPGKRGRPGYDQQTVLNVAVDVFNRHGYEATSMGILAENLGITKSAIYHHVPSKGDLLRLALDHALDGLEAVLDDPRASTGAADARLEFVLRGTIDVLTARLPFVTLLLRLRGNLLQIFFLSGLMLQSLLKLPDFQLKRSSFFLCLFL